MVGVLTLAFGIDQMFSQMANFDRPLCGASEELERKSPEAEASGLFCMY